MGKLIGTGFGLFTGKVGSVVGFHANNQYLVRAYQKDVANPKTPAQLVQRAKFSAIIEQFRSRYVDIPTKYGTIGTYAFQRGVQQFLQCGLNKVINNGSYQITGLKSIFNTIGVNVNMDGLNILDPRRMVVTKSTLTGGGSIYYFEPKNWPMANPGIKYFGCDYRLVQNGLYCIYMTSRGDIKNSYVGITPGIQTTPSDPDGVRNLGIYDTIDECGSGWSYYYKTTTHGAFISTDPEGSDALDCAGSANVNGGEKGCASFIIYQKPIAGESQSVPVILCNGTLLLDTIESGPNI